MLNEAQTCFLEALRLSVLGKKYDLGVSSAEVFRQILHIASIQKVLPLICETIYESESVRKYSGIFSAYQKRAVDEVVSQTVRTAQFFDLYQYLDSQGLRPVVVKGLAVRKFYPRENLRMSVDEDLLILPQEKFLYHKALLAYGMQQMELNQDVAKDTEISYTDPGSGLYIEVHQYLLPPDSEAYGDWNRFFENVDSLEIEYKGQRLLTLDPTDHVFFLLCHSFKHFLHSGFGIRQVCDLVLLSDAFADQIDWKRIWSQCQEIHADGFARAIYRIGEKYLLSDNRYHSHMKQWDIEAVDEEPLLMDMLAGGILGASEMSRLHSSNITLNAVVNQKNNKRADVSVWSSIFLPLKSMRGRYRYLEKAPFLLPIAWLQRILQYADELKKQESTGNHVAVSIRLGRERVELLRRYGVIK